jgi:D-sedoheptulose 7-phosphate isomerase
MTNVVKEIEATIATFQKFASDQALIALVEAVGAKCAACLESGNKILIAGNGGSAADAQHIAAEFVSRLTVERVPLAAIALTTDTSILTACGNDYGFETVFERQVRALGRKGDVFLGISTSGNSANVIRALAAARELGLTTVALTGQNGGQLTQSAEFSICVPSTRTQNIQEVHIMIGHTICALAEESFLPRGQSSALAR